MPARMEIPMYDNYIFDLYGTLLDIHTNEKKPSLWKKMAEIYSSLGASYTTLELKKNYLQFCREEIARVTALVHENPDAEIRNVFRALFTLRGIKPSDELISYIAITFRSLSRDKLQVYPHLFSLFDALKSQGKKIYLLSNAQSAFTLPELAMTGLLPVFDGILISSDVGICKPDARFMEQLLSRYSLDRARSIMVGNDRSSDILIANRCHMDSLFIQTDISPALTASEHRMAPSEQRATYEILDGDFARLVKTLLA